MNNTILIGNLVKDPSIRYTQEGKAVCDFTIAVARPFNRDEADFIRVVTWGKTAENCAKFLKKGSKCAVNGWIKTGSYEKEGRTIYTTDVMANQVEFLSKPKSEDSTSIDSDTDLSDLGQEVLPF